MQNRKYQGVPLEPTFRDVHCYVWRREVVEVESIHFTQNDILPGVVRRRLHAHCVTTGVVYLRHVQRLDRSSILQHCVVAVGDAVIPGL